jgi:4-phytase/acid phosphatase
LASGPAELKYVVIVSRHGVRSPTWDVARLNQYSAQPWPDWGVAPGELTSHGRAQIKLMGTYYRDWLLQEGILGAGCASAERIQIRADKGQRTLETGKALAESLAPGCEVKFDSRSEGKDTLFSGTGKPDNELARLAIHDRLGPDPRTFLGAHRPALDALRLILTGGHAARLALTEFPPEESGAADGGQTAPFGVASSMSEDMLLEYENGFAGNDLGWGRLTKENLFQVLELHRVYADLARRTPYLARARGSNLLAHVLRSLEQAASGKAVSGALDSPGHSVLVLSGHDTNLSNLSGMLGLSWSLPGYQPDDTPPGGALLFSLWQALDTHEFFVKTEYIAPSLDQVRNLVPLKIAEPPSRQTVVVPGCAGPGAEKACPWQTFKSVLERAIDRRFTDFDAAAGNSRAK